MSNDNDMDFGKMKSSINQMEEMVAKINAQMQADGDDTHAFIFQSGNVSQCAMNVAGAMREFLTAVNELELAAKRVI